MTTPLPASPDVAGWAASDPRWLALLALSTELATAPDLDSLLRRVADGVVQTLGYQYAILFLITADQKQKTLAAISGIPLPLLEQLETIVGLDLTRLILNLDDLDSPAGRAVQAGEVFITSDVMQVFHPPFSESACLQVQELMGLKTLADLPLLSRGRLVGSLLVTSVQPALSAAEVNLLRVFAERTAAAIDNIRLQVDVAAAQDRTRLLLDIQSAIAARLELRAILSLVVGGAVRAVGAKSGLLALLDPQTQEIVSQAAYGLPAGLDPAPLLLSLITSLHDQIVVAGRSVRMDSLPAPAALAPGPLSSLSRGLIAVPIRLPGRTIGVLSVHDQRSRQPFTADDEALLATMADQAATAIEQARLYEELRHRVQEQAALNLIAETAGRSLDLQEVLESSLERVLDVTGLAGGVVYLPDEAGQRLILAAHRDLQGRLLPRLAAAQLDTDLVGQVFHTGRATQVVLTAADVCGPLFAAESKQPISFAAVPLRAKGQVLGVMGVGELATLPISAQDMDLLTAIGNQIGLALENARLYAEAQQRVRDLALLNELATATGESLDLDAVLEQSMRYMRALTYAERQVVYLRDNLAPTLSLRSTQGFPPDTPPTPWPLGADLSVDMVPQEIIVWNIPANSTAPGDSQLPAPGIRTIIQVPLRSRGTAMGVIHLWFARPRTLTTAERQLLDTVGRQISTAVENAQLYEAARRMAVTDGLTALYNYRYFYETLTHEIERIQRYDGSLALVMLDLDNFKEYNDVHGHLAGDDLLVELAHLLRGQIRKVDTAARYGGEEIAILLPETDLTQAHVVAERIRRTIATHDFVVRGTQVRARITVSLGVAVFPDHATGPRELVHAADMALYAAKRTGKNCICLAEMSGGRGDAVMSGRGDGEMG